MGSVSMSLLLTAPRGKRWNQMPASDVPQVSDIIDPVIEKLPMTFTEEEKSEFALNPPAGGEENFGDYRIRVKSLVPAQRPRIEIPFGSKFKNYTEYVEARFKRLEDVVDRLRFSKLTIDKANLLKAAAQKIIASDKGESSTIPMVDYQPGAQSDSQHSSNTIVQRASNFSSKTLKAAGVDPKYLPKFHKLGKFICDRTHEAHDVSESLADLLWARKESGHGDYDEWKDLFEYVYGETVEAVVERVRGNEVPF